MGFRDLFRRAEQAVQDTRQSVTAGVVIAVAALIVALVGIMIAVRR
jgi:hypothetical protein